MASAANEKNESNTRADDVHSSPAERSIDKNEEKEGLKAWLQVLGAFVLNLNTW